jgi:hypothetical protein
MVHRNGRVPPTVVAVTGSPKVDGVLDDPAWAAAPPVSGFRRDYPSDGKPAADDAEVRVLYDRDAMYIGARLFARPGTVSRRLSRRDSFTIFNDVFFVLVDSYHDHTTTFVFGVTPAGERRDAVQASDGGNLDMSWDPVWSAKTKIDSLGWVAEIRIPFSQLRFPDASEQVWGIQFRRDIRSAAEAVDWAWSPRTEPGSTSKYGHLLGIRDIPAPGRLEVLPYVSSQARLTRGADATNPFDDGSHTSAGAGIDLKYGVTSDLTLQATVNPDFGQVEADPAVVNLTAFETFFEERRPFFVEGADIFGFGPPGGQVPLFYSRRVGRAPSISGFGTAAYVDQPASTSILGAAKLSGRTRSGWSMALLEAVTAKEYARRADAAGAPLDDLPVEPLSNYAVGRLRRDFRGGSSAVGAMFTAVNRDLDEAVFNPLRQSAYTGGVDWLHRFRKNAWAFGGYLGGSWVNGSTTAMLLTQSLSSRYFQRPDQDYVTLDSTRTALAGMNGGIGLSETAGNWVFTARGNFVTPGYEGNDAGFQTDADRIRLVASAGRRWLAPGPLFRQVSAGINGSQAFNFGSTSVGRNLSADIDGTFNSMWSFGIDLGWGFQSYDDKATRGGPRLERPAGWHLGGGLRSDSRKAVSFGASGFFTGHVEGTQGGGGGVELVYRPQGSVDFSASANYQAFDYDQFYVTQHADPAATDTYGRRYLFSALDQDQLSFTFRLNWVVTPNLSLQWYAQPFLATGDYDRYSYVRTPSAYDYATYGEDGSTITYDEAANRYTATAGPGAAAVTFTNPDFRVRSLRSNLVMRWEYLPGSTLFVVWNQSRATQVGDPRFNSLKDVWGIWDDPMQNVLLVKVNYYLSR